jgi:signal peptidase I
MHWILQNNLFHEDAYQTLLDTLERMELPYSIHKVVPFVGELVPEPDLSHYNVICMGSYSMRHAADKYDWEPGVFDLEPEDFTIQLKHWGEHMLNADSKIAPFKDVNFDDELMFLRPTQDSKVFAGKVFTKEEFYEWKRKVVVLEEDYGNSLTKDTLIQFTVPKLIFAEYRFWIVKGKIITKSLYKRGDKVVYSSDVDERFDEYVKLRVKEWQPHDAFVIDVCDTPDGIKIVEINTLNSCGFYAADVPKLVDALEYAFNDDQIAPDPGTKKYIRIVEEGCKGTRDYWGEYDCEYSWVCDYCPVVTSRPENEPPEQPEYFTFEDFTTGTSK